MTLGAGGHAAALSMPVWDRLVGVDRDRAGARAGARSASPASASACASCTLGSPRSMRTSSADRRRRALRPRRVVDAARRGRSAGFSFRQDGPLDMRMAREPPTSRRRPISSTGSPNGELADLIYRFGDERRSRRIARRDRAPPADHDHRSSSPASSSAPWDASGGPPPCAPDVPGAPHRGQPGTRGARRLPASGGRAPRSRWPRGRASPTTRWKTGSPNTRSATTRVCASSPRSRVPPVRRRSRGIRARGAQSCAPPNGSRKPRERPRAELDPTEPFQRSTPREAARPPRRPRRARPARPSPRLAAGAPRVPAAFWSWWGSWRAR